MVNLSFLVYLLPTFLQSLKNTATFSYGRISTVFDLLLQKVNCLTFLKATAFFAVLFYSIYINFTLFCYLHQQLIFKNPFFFAALLFGQVEFFKVSSDCTFLSLIKAYHILKGFSIDKFLKKLCIYLYKRQKLFDSVKFFFTSAHNI